MSQTNGRAVYGSQKVTIGGKQFICKNIKMPKFTYGVGTCTDELGNEDGEWYMKKNPQGTMTLQFPDATTPSPDDLAEVTLKPVGGGAGVIWIIVDCGEQFDSGGETLAECTIRRKHVPATGGAQ